MDECGALCSAYWGGRVEPFCCRCSRCLIGVASAQPLRSQPCAFKSCKLPLFLRHHLAPWFPARVAAQVFIECLCPTPGSLHGPLLGCRCGCAEGLEAGRHCLNKWGFRRSEDICWIKTNNDHGNRKYLSAVHQEHNSVLVRTKVRGGVPLGASWQLVFEPVHLQGLGTVD